MCQLCSQDPIEKRAAINAHLDAAASLGRLVQDYKNLAHGVVMPHTQDAKRIGERAVHLIRMLVEDWL